MNKDYQDYKDYAALRKRILAKQPKNIWDNQLGFWCPAQCCLQVVDAKGNEYELYLRWRHTDPWTFSVQRKYNDNGKMRFKYYTPKSFPFFMDKQYKAAEAWAEYWYETRKYKLDSIFEKLEFVYE